VSPGLPAAVRVISTAALAAALAAVAGCGAAGPSGSGDGGGPASAAGPDTCTLLNAAQLRLMRLSPGQHRPGPNSGECVWSAYPLALGVEYSARLLPGPPPEGAAAPRINNLPTVEYVPDRNQQRTRCGYVVTLAERQQLLAGYSDTRGQVAGMTHRVACQRAQGLAANLASTFIATRPSPTPR
jgi:hypothetical protein